MKAGFLVGDLASVVVSEKRFKEAAQLSGLNVVYESTYPITGPANAETYVQQAKAAGVQLLMIVGTPDHVVAFEKGMQTLNWYPDAIVEAANIYDQILIKDGGSALKNTWVYSNFVPYEANPTQYPAVQQFTSLMAKYNPKGKIANLSLNTWNSWLLFATAAKACGSNLTRACLLQNGGSQTAWTGGGLLGGPVNTNPASAQVPDCYLTVKAEASGFSIDPTFLPPNTGIFDCDPANVVTLKGNYSS
jgi:ABC-type branched-subunit amino acid transport system substrate-binding protein